MRADPQAYLESQRGATAMDEEMTEIWNEVDSLYAHRLWHQLTLQLFVLIERPEMKDAAADRAPPLVDLYEKFIADFETKINLYSLVEICTHVEKQIEDKDEAVQFLEKIAEKVKSVATAYALARVHVGAIQLSRGNIDETKKIVEQVEPLLDEVDGVGKVHAEFYHLTSLLYKHQGKHAEYYRAVLHYLGCMELSDLGATDAEDLAFQLGLAALLGNGVYNFGELLAHPILDRLRNTDRAWLVQLLFAFNSGDVDKYKRLSASWQRQPDLKANEAVLFEKICLLSLMEMAFKRPSTERQLTFEDVAQNTGLGKNQVELLVMRALSQGLVRGTIDQVAATVNLTWVQPRVLDRDQLTAIVGKINAWSSAVAAMENMIENNAAEILTN